MIGSISINLPTNQTQIVHVIVRTVWKSPVRLLAQDIRNLCTQFPESPAIQWYKPVKAQFPTAVSNITHRPIVCISEAGPKLTLACDLNLTPLYPNGRVHGTF